MKKILRERLKEQRKAMSAAEVAKRSLQISIRFESELDLRDRRISVFLSITSNNEVNTMPILETLAQHNRIFVPITDTASHTIHHSEYRPGDPTTLGDYHIPQPMNVRPVDNSLIDVVITPLLACDRAGHRIGYGAGYYDRFFMDNPRALRIGVSFFPPLEEVIPAEGHDVPLDLCVAPDEIFTFPGCRLEL